MELLFVFKKSNLAKSEYQLKITGFDIDEEALKVAKS